MLSTYFNNMDMSVLIMIYRLDDIPTLELVVELIKAAFIFFFFCDSFTISKLLSVLFLQFKKIRILQLGVQIIYFYYAIIVHFNRVSRKHKTFSRFFFLPINTKTGQPTVIDLYIYIYVDAEREALRSEVLTVGHTSSRFVHSATPHAHIVHIRLEKNVIISIFLLGTRREFEKRLWTVYIYKREHFLKLFILFTFAFRQKTTKIDVHYTHVSSSRDLSKNV